MDRVFAFPAAAGFGRESATRAWLVAAALVLLPLIVYGPTIAHEYGFRDDYAHLREVREVPGWLTRLTAASGRPLYGYVLEAALTQVQSVAGLAALRLVSCLLLSALAVLLWQHLRRSGWSDLEAATLGAAASLLPGAQVIAGWAIAWPIALGLVAAAAGFSLIDTALARSGWRRRMGIAAGALLYFAAGLTYQTTALFAVMPLAAVLLMRHRDGLGSDARWIATHLSLLFLSLVVGWLLMSVLFTSSAVPAAAHMQFESDPLRKLLWFARNPLPNAMALFALRDSLATPLSFYLTLAAAAGVSSCGFLYGATSTAQRRRWLFAVLVLPFIAHAVSLAASSQAIGYRTLLPLSGLFLVLAMFGLRALMMRLKLRQGMQVGICSTLLASAAWLAQYNAYNLIAEPQGREWQLVQDSVERLRLDADTRIYLVRPLLEDRSTQRVYADEFGSLSSDAEWAAEEMFKTAMRERFPDGLPRGAHYGIDTGVAMPAAPVDAVVDLRELREERDQDSGWITAVAWLDTQNHPRSSSRSPH